MTHSQIIARIFALVGYFIVVPGGFGMFLFVILLFFLLAPAKTNGVELLAPLFSLPYIAGVILLVGYHRHYRGSLSQGKIVPLWIGTIVLNSLLLVLQLVIVFQKIRPADLNRSLQETDITGGLILAVFIWQMTAVWLGISALISELSANRNSGNVP